MRKYIISITIIISIVVFAGCSLRNPLSDTEQLESEELYRSFVLPSDQSGDVPRAHSGEFSFETLFPVVVSVSVYLYDPAAETDLDGNPVPAPPADGQVMVTFNDSSGNPVYAGTVDEEGFFSGTLFLPAAPEDITMRLRADGYAEREVIIRDMVEYAEINRTMGMAAVPPDADGFQSRIFAGTDDRDGDGVPDVYDAYPDDENSAFKNQIPAEGNLTIAFEDLYGLADAGDADYNDFIAEYHIIESSNDNGISSITVIATMVQKLAGYYHTFGIRLNSFAGTGTLDVTHIDDSGKRVTTSHTDVKAPLEINLFDDSRVALGKTAWFTLTFAQDQVYETIDDDEEEIIYLSNPPFNPYLVVVNTGHDIHLIGEEPNTQTDKTKKIKQEILDKTKLYRDKKGFPWALLVPADWIHPEETQRIEIPYPRFTLWRESGGEEHTDWYNHYYDPWEPPEDNNPPTAYFEEYQVAGAGIAAANDVYFRDGVLNDLPFYSQTSGGDYNIFSSFFDDPESPAPAGDYWCLDPDETVTDPDDVDYLTRSSNPTPPASTWSAWGTTGSPATISELPVFTGTAAVGETLTVQYVFQDPDAGDTEGASTYRWFRCVDPESDGVEISGATDRSYTAVSADGGLFLKVEVTPVDSRGESGTPAMSRASSQIGS